MSIDADTIESMLGQALTALKENKPAQAYLLVTELKGYCSGIQDSQIDWEKIRELYKAGFKPKAISKRYPAVSPRQIVNRAYSENWPNPGKIKKAMVTRKKGTFYPTCKLCEYKFEATNGRAIVCPQCKALDRENKAREERSWTE